MFDQCAHKSQKGGSLYICSKNGASILDRVCSYGSKCRNHGAFCYLEVSYPAKARNYIIDSTVTLSGYTSGYTTDAYNILFRHGETYIKSVNISYSRLSYDSIFYVDCLSDTNFTLSTFSNNTSTWGSQYAELICHNGVVTGVRYFFCNYFGNKGYVLIRSDYILSLFNCSFADNNIDLWYFNANKKIQLIGCYFDISNPSFNGEVIITENARLIYPERPHLSTGICIAKIRLKFLKIGHIETEKEKEIEAHHKRRQNTRLFIFLLPKG